MSTSRRAKYRGNFPAMSRSILRQARFDPGHRCWRCGLTLAEVRAKFPGRRVSWDAGHTTDPLLPLAAECSPCNRADGARRGNALRRAAGLDVSEVWF